MIKKFISKSILFFVLVLCVLLGVELVLYSRPNDYTRKEKYVEEHYSSIRGLLMGNSLVTLSLDPTLIGKDIYNFALSGRTTYYDVKLLEKHLPHFKNLEYVVFPLGYDMQFDSYKYPVIKRDKNTLTNTYRCMYEKYMGITSPDGFPYEYWSELMYSSFDYKKRLYSDKVGYDSLGYELHGNSARPADWYKKGLPFVKFQNPQNVVPARQENIEYYKTMASLCKQYGVKFVVITFPVWKTSKELMQPERVKDLYACVDTMKRVNPDVLYFDYLYDKRFDEDDFSDAFHMSKAGCKKMSQVFKEEVLPIASKRQ